MVCYKDDQLTFVESDVRQYGFTLRRTNLKKGNLDEKLYVSHLTALSVKLDFKIIDYVFETDSGLHMHGIIELQKNFPVLRFRIRGWNMKIEELYDEIGWVAYMGKHLPKELPEAPLLLTYSLFPKD